MGNVGVKVQKEALKKLTDIYRIPKKEEPKCHKDKRKGGERGSQAESSKRSLRVRKLTAVEQRMPLDHQPLKEPAPQQQGTSSAA